MTKKELVHAFIEQLEQDLAAIREAARATHEAATHEESKAENQYDTRGLEASYLAGAQAKRAAEIDEILALFRNLAFNDFGEGAAVQSTAIVKINVEGKKSTILMMPMGGGVSLHRGPETIQIVTPSSLLGESIMGLEVGDVGEFEIGPNIRKCEILAIS